MIKTQASGIIVCFNRK